MQVIGVWFPMEEFGCHHDGIFTADLVDLLLARLVARFLGSQRQLLPVAVITPQVMVLLGDTKNAQL